MIMTPIFKTHVHKRNKMFAHFLREQTYKCFSSSTLPVIHFVHTIYKNIYIHSYCKSFYKLYILQSYLQKIKYFESKYKNFLFKKKIEYRLCSYINLVFPVCLPYTEALGGAVDSRVTNHHQTPN